MNQQTIFRKEIPTYETAIKNISTESYREVYPRSSISHIEVLLSLKENQLLKVICNRFDELPKDELPEMEQPSFGSYILNPLAELELANNEYDDINSDEAVAKEIKSTARRELDIKQAYAEKRIKELFEGLYAWYNGNYPSELTATLDRSGIHRRIDFKQAMEHTRQVKNETLVKYDFAVPFPEQSIQECLTGENWFANTTEEQILHLCVAFYVSLENIDETLAYYGFSKLHMRNIHDFAIASVMRKADYVKGQTCFDKVRENYIKFLEHAQFADPTTIVKIGKIKTDIVVKDYLEPPDMQQADHYSQKPTEAISDYLSAVGDQADIDKLLNFVYVNRNAFSGRKTRLLQEYFDLIARFYKTEKNLYTQDGAPLSSSPAAHYAFMNFISKFVTDNDVKYMRESMTSKIKNFKERHLPTREIMVLLWIFKYCNEWQMECDEWEKKHNEGKNDVPYTFNGEDCIRKINENLMYGRELKADEKLEQPVWGWGVLNDRRNFDHMVKSVLSRIKIEKQEQEYCYKLIYNGEHSENFSTLHFEDPNFLDTSFTVSAPWKVWFDIFDQIVGDQMLELPLKCKLYGGR